MIHKSISLKYEPASEPIHISSRLYDYCEEIVALFIKSGKDGQKMSVLEKRLAARLVEEVLY